MPSRILSGRASLNRCRGAAKHWRRGGNRYSPAHSFHPPAGLAGVSCQAGESVMSLRNKLVTVFGGSGFIGRYVVKRLAEQGARVRVAIRRPAEGLFLKPMGNVGQIDIVQDHIRMPLSVQQAVAGADYVINCLGIARKRVV